MIKRTSRRCKRCHKVKAIDQYITPNRRICTYCIKRQWRINHPDRFKACQANWRKLNKDKIKKYSRKYYLKKRKGKNGPK